ncbi:MAG: glycosyltransferase family A protein [Candidatus Paracaedibacteraceae bacterium]|nr:glycosyltransferase family A protein [Candidatus Paracaedibacteraceae bacterium]
MGNVPLVCICVPTYNAAGTVRETLVSILAQSYPNLVVHVSDNASTDDTLQVIESIADPRVTIHRHEENIGGEGNFNRCIQLAEGKYTAIFHADDVYEPDMVAKQVAFLEAHPTAGAVFTEASTIDEYGNKIGEIRLPQHIESMNGLYDFATMFKAVLRHSNFFICPSVMVRTQIYQQEIKCWRGELFNTSADLDLWLRILQHHSIGYLAERLIRYRISRNQWSAKIRMGTERADFFLVTDYYLAQVPIRNLLDVEAFQNYRWLERRDRAMRAVNLMLMDRSSQASELLHDIISMDALRAATRTKRGLLVLLIGLYVMLASSMGLSKVGKLPLRYMKQVTGK